MKGSFSHLRLSLCEGDLAQNRRFLVIFFLYDAMIVPPLPPNLKPSQPKGSYPSEICF